MRRQHHFVKTLGATIGDDANALKVAFDQTHRGVQTLVGNIGNDFFDVVPRTAFDGPPLWPIGDLN